METSKPRSILGESTNIRIPVESAAKAAEADASPKAPPSSSVSVHLRVRPMLPEEKERGETSVFRFLE